MSQRIREVERDRKFEEYANREGDIVTGIIQQTDTRYTLLDLGRVEALLPQAEQVPYERPLPAPRAVRRRRAVPPTRAAPPAAARFAAGEPAQGENRSANACHPARWRSGWPRAEISTRHCGYPRGSP